MPKSIRQQISAMIISREEMRFLVFMSGVSAFGVPADTSFLSDRVRFLSPSDTRFTMAATIFTAVDTAPRIIRMEINGVINPFPIPFCTISSVGTLVPAISGLVETVIIPRQTIVIISALMRKPSPMLLTASPGFLNTLACWTNTAMFASWNVP